MAAKQISFSVHRYDERGDINERGVFLHIDDASFKVCDTVAQFSQVVSNLETIHKELIEENYE